MDRSCCCDEGRGKPSRICGSSEYIVEKVIDRFRQSCCYSGHLTLEQGQNNCPPLCLRHVEVTDIKPVCTSCCHPCGMQRLCLTLTLFGTDGRGCRYQAQTQIEVEVRNAQNRPNVGLENLRRGARVCVKYAQYCPSVGFDVELLIEIETLITCLCVMGQKGVCTQNCPQLPLYPPPPQHKGECSCEWPG